MKNAIESINNKLSQAVKGICEIKGTSFEISIYKRTKKKEWKKR